MRCSVFDFWRISGGAPGDLDHPSTTARHAKTIRQKFILRRLYEEFYRTFSRASPAGRRVELGSGGGFIKDAMPGVVTSDVVRLEGVDMVFAGESMPFSDESVDALFMVDVFHHLTNPALFLKEAERCLRPGGKVVLIEPANTPWARFIYRNFHSETFDADAGWTRPAGGRLSDANVALPWIVFQRDRARFDREFPKLRLARWSPHTPFRYLASGGLSFRPFVPWFLYPAVVALEKLLSPWNHFWAMFVTIELEKR